MIFVLSLVRAAVLTNPTYQNKTPCSAIHGSADDLLLSPGLCICDKTWGGNDFISLERGKTLHVISDPWNGPSFVLPPHPG